MGAKRAAGRFAADLVEDGMAVGLGTGSTVRHALDRLAERIAAEQLRIRGVATSRQTEQRARCLGIPLATLDECPALDLAIDGADEVDPAKNLVKGGGGALMREKVVAAAAREMVVIIGRDKLVDRLGLACPVPVEVLPFACRPVCDRLVALGGEPFVRTDEGGGPFVSDNGNRIVDCRFPGIDDPAGLEAELDAIPGLLASGLFVGLAGRVVVGDDDAAVDVR